MEVLWNEIAMDMFSLLTCKVCLCYSMRSHHFSELVERAREELHYHGDDDIVVEGVLHLGSPPNMLKKM
jgi:hypothetical protein